MKKILLTGLALATLALGSAANPGLTISGLPTLGSTLTFDGQLSAPGPALLLFDTQLGPTTVAGVQLDIALSGSFFWIPMPATGTAQTSLSVSIPSDPALVGMSWFAELVELGTLSSSGAVGFTLSAIPERFVDGQQGSDANDGSLLAPWKTIQKAANAAAAGELVHIAAGSYKERVEVHVSGNATAGPIIFQGDPAGGTVIDGSGFTNADFNQWSGAAGQALVDITDQSYVRLEHLEVHGLHTASTNYFLMGVQVVKTPAAGAMGHIELHDVDVHDIRYTGTSDAGGAQGIAVYGMSTSAALTDLVIDSCEVHDLRLGQSESMTVNGNVDGFALTNNHVHDNDNIGIVCIGWEGTAGGSQSDNSSDANAHLYGGHNPVDRARNGTIAKNLVERCSTDAPVHNPTYPLHDFSAGGIYVDGGHDIVIDANTVIACDVGIELGCEHGGVDTNGVLRGAENLIARNNVVLYCGQTGIGIGGYNKFRGVVTQSEVLGNTVFKCGSLGWGGGQLLVSKSNGNLFANNIFVARGLSDTSDYDGFNNSGNDWKYDHGVLISSGVGSANNFGNTLDHNLYFTEGGPSKAYWKWEMDDNKDPVQGFNGIAAIDAAAIFADPAFVHATLSLPSGTEDLHLTAASVASIDTADSSLPNIGPTDHDGQARIQGPGLDRGAYEL